MANPELTQVLRQLVSANAAGQFPTSAQKSGLAQDLVRFNTAGVKPFVSAGNMGKRKEQPSVLSRIFDILSRPLYGVANYTKSLIKDPEDLGTKGFLDVGEFFEGLTGKEKTTGSDVLKAAGMEKGPLRAVLGFGTDIALDPLTYVGIGLAKNLGKGAIKGVEALGELGEETAGATRTAMRNIGEFDIPKPPRKSLNLDMPLFGDIVPRPTPKPAGTDLTIREHLQELLDTEIKAGNKTTAAMISAKLKDMPEFKPVTPKDVTAKGRAEKVAKELAEEEIAAGASPPIRNLLKAVTGKTSQDAVKKAESIKAAGIRSADEILEEAKATGAQVKMREFPLINISTKQQEEANELATKFAKANKHEEINPVGQKRLLDRIVTHVNKTLHPGLKGLSQARANVAFQMLRLAEENLKIAGRKFVDGDGNSIRLSDIILEAGGAKALSAFSRRTDVRFIDDWVKNRPTQIHETVKAAQATEVADKTIDPVLSTASNLDLHSLGVLPVARAREVKDELGDALKELTREAGLVSKDIEASKAFLRQLFDVSNDAAEDLYKRQAKDILRVVAIGKMNPATLIDMNKAVYKVLGSNPKHLAGKIGENRAVEAIMTRMATWWGAKDLRPWAREYIDSMLIHAAQFEKKWAPVWKKTTKEQRLSAMSAAQGHLPPVSADEENLANLFKWQMERLFNGTGVKPEKLPGSSVVTRSGITMRELNEALRSRSSKFQFTNKTGIDDFGRGYDYSQGSDWMKSWESWNFGDDDPIEGLYEVFGALQLVTRKNAFLDDAAARWGIATKGGEFTSAVNHPRLHGFWFPKVIAEQMNTTLKRFGTDEFIGAKGPVLQTFDRVQRAWKSGVTVYSPAHHIRNVNGDLFLASLDGVVSPRPYYIAMRVMHANKGRYRDIMDLDDITDPASYKRALTTPGDIVLTTKAGHKITAEQLYKQAYNKGILTQIRQIEEVGREIGSKPLVPKIFGGRVQEFAHATSETRDHLVRLGHFIDVVRKSKFKNLDQIYEEAARRVKKFHPDGMDLTGFEKNVMRRIIPFYSWLRKSTPLILEGIVMRPHLTMAYPKGMMAIQEMSGIEGVSGFGDPFPADQMFPEWIREKGIGPIVNPPGAGGPLQFIADLARQSSYKGEEPGYTVVNPSNPMIDQIAQYSNIRKGMLSSLTPLVSIPYSFLSERTTLGVPITNAPAFLAEQLPPVGIAARLSGLGREAEGRGEEFSPEALINWLTAGGVRGTGPYRRQAKYELEQALREEAIARGRNRE